MKIESKESSNAIANEFRVMLLDDEFLTKIHSIRITKSVQETCY